LLCQVPDIELLSVEIVPLNVAEYVEPKYGPVVSDTELPVAVPVIGLNADPLADAAVPENEPEDRSIEVILKTCAPAPPDPQQSQDPTRSCVVLAPAAPAVASTPQVASVHATSHRRNALLISTHPVSSRERGQGNSSRRAR
jgi:hypothetical protein